MFGSKKILTESEKIDYIYKKIRNKARMDNVMLGIRLAIFGGIIYFYVYMLPKIDTAALIDKYAIPYMSKIVQMTAEKTMQSVGGNLGNIDANTLNNVLNNSSSNSVSQGTSGSTQQRRKNVTNNSINGVKITPEMIDAAKQILNNQ